MQLVWRPIDRRELDHELLWLSVSIAGLALATAWLALGLPWPICWFHELTGQPCATCGATRAAIAFFHGQFLKSWQWNPLVFICCLLIAAFDVYALAVLIVRGRRLRPILSTREKRILRAAVIGILLVNWVYLLSHSTMFRG